MKEKVFRNYLISQGISQDGINTQVNFIRHLHQHLEKLIPSWTLEDLGGASTQTIVDDLIDRGENSLENLQAISRYALSVQNEPLHTVIFQMLECHEAMDKLYETLAFFAGEDLRDIIFEDMPIPPLGLSRQEKSRYTYRLIYRMETIFEESTTREILKDSLRTLPDKMFLKDKGLFFEDCQGDVDQYLLSKGQRFIKCLQGYHDRRELFFGQEIDDEVIALLNPTLRLVKGSGRGM